MKDREPNYYCLDCNNEIFVDLEKIHIENGTVRVSCRCGKTFMLATRKIGEEYHAYTYKMFHGQEISAILQNILQTTKIPVNVQDELVKFAFLNRWTSFKETVKRYYTKLSGNTSLMNFLAENILI